MTVTNSTRPKRLALRPTRHTCFRSAGCRVDQSIHQGRLVVPLRQGDAVTRPNGERTVGPVEYHADDETVLEDQALQRAGGKHLDVAFVRLRDHPVGEVELAHVDALVDVADRQYLDQFTVGTHLGGGPTRNGGVEHSVRRSEALRIPRAHRRADEGLHRAVVRFPRARKPSRHVSGIEALRQRIETLGDSREVIVRLDVQHIVLQPAAQRTDTPTGGDGRNVTRAHIG